MVARGDDPLITPAEPLAKSATDITFVASAVETDEGIILYFSQSDQDLRRALVRRA